VYGGRIAGCAVGRTGQSGRLGRFWKDQVAVFDSHHSKMGMLIGSCAKRAICSRSTHVKALDPWLMGGGVEVAAKNDTVGFHGSFLSHCYRCALY
jgi:hypothetical protein